MQTDLADVSAEGSSTVMILTVNVVGDDSADSNEARARRDGKKPSFRKEYIENIGKAGATFAAQHPSRFVEPAHPVEATAVAQFSAGVETGVAVAPAERICE